MERINSLDYIDEVQKFEKTKKKQGGEIIRQSSSLIDLLVADKRLWVLKLPASIVTGGMAWTMNDSVPLLLFRTFLLSSFSPCTVYFLTEVSDKFVSCDVFFMPHGTVSRHVCLYGACYIL